MRFTASVSSTIRWPFLVFTAPVVESSERKSVFMMKLAGGCWWVSSAPACPSIGVISKRFSVASFLPILAAFALLVPLHLSFPFKDSHIRLFHAALTVSADDPFEFCKKSGSRQTADPHGGQAHHTKRRASQTSLCRRNRIHEKGTSKVGDWLLVTGDRRARGPFRARAHTRPERSRGIHPRPFTIHHSPNQWARKDSNLGPRDYE